jgi:hypothetical protein
VAQKSPTKRPDPGVAIGHVFLGKYRVEEILGVGGMGVVTKCMHMQLGELVAIKMLRKDALDDQDAVERFMREAQAAAKLRSEYVARVIDVGRFEDNVPYMIMEFLDGLDLGGLLDQRGSLPIQWAVEMMMQTAEALAEAHSIGIVHRDVKPTNLFVTWRPDGSALVKVLDFGIARAPMGNDLKLTQTQSLLGTPAYMSPEQMRSARMVDARSDIWSLGTVLYELIEGRRPFEAESFSEMCVKVAVDDPMPMQKAPPALEQVVMRCLSKSPEQRYANMAELANALRPFMRDPKTAGILVERMHRMIERGAQIDWAVGTPIPTVPPLSPAALVGAGRLVGAGAPAAGAGTAAGDDRDADGADAAMGDAEPIPAKIVQPPRPNRRHRAGSDSTLKGPPQRRSALVFVGVAALLGVAIGLVVFLVGGFLRGSPEPKAEAALEPPKSPPKSIDQSGQPGQANPSSPPSPPAQIEQKAEPKLAPELVVSPPATPSADKDPVVSPAGSPAPVKPTRPAVRKPTGPGAKESAKPEQPAPPTPPPAPDCIPENNPHGCPKR